MSDLVACAQRVIEEANALWVELGLDGAARVAKLNTFIASIEGALETLLAQERAERDRVKQDLVEKTRQIMATSEALGIETPQLDICTLPLLPSAAVVTECLAGLEERRAKVAACLDALLAQLGVLKAQLGDMPDVPELESRTDLRKAHLDQLRATIESLERTRQKRVAQARANAARVAALCADMREAVPECVADVCGAAAPDAVCVSAENMQRISDVLSACEKMHAQRVDVLKTLKHSIRVHYIKLGLPDAELEAFLATVQTTELRAVEACKAELSRLFELKRANAARLVDVALARVRELWDILAVPPERRVLPPPCAQFFAAANLGEPQSPAVVHGVLSEDSNCCGGTGGTGGGGGGGTATQPARALLDDDQLAATLAALEAQARALEECRRALAPIVQRIEERKRLVREREEFEFSAADPTRFRRRGYNAVTEDQQRRRFYVTLPRLETALIARLREWAAAHGPFYYDGVDYLAVLEREHAAAQQQQQQRQPIATKHRRVPSAHDDGDSAGTAGTTTTTKTTKTAPVAAGAAGAGAAGKASSRRKRAVLKRKLGGPAPAAPGVAVCGKKGAVVAPAEGSETQRRRARRPRASVERSGTRLASLARRVAAQQRLNRRLCPLSPLVPLIV